MYKIIQKRKIWLSLSGLAVIFSIVTLFIWGLNFGIDYTGGSLLEVKFLEERPNVTEVQEALVDLNLGSLVVQPIGENEMILRFQDISEEKHQEALNKLKEMAGSQPVKNPESENKIFSPKELGIEIGGESTEGLQVEMVGAEDTIFNLEELRYDSVGPSIGNELKQKSLYAIVIVLIAIVLYIAWAFRKVSKPVASWKYGLASIIALFHDVMIVLGLFAVLGKFFDVEINAAFIAAILTVLGYSVNDTIVVFDRIRENLPKSEEDFEGTINTSVNQTLTRSINTSLTTLLVLLSILFFGGSTIRDFVLALSIGVFVGTYSSIFLASPILVVWEKMKSHNV